MGDVDWQRTVRLIHGSLLALSCDGFETIIWATVAHREPALLASPTPSIDVAIPEGEHYALQQAQATGKAFIMVRDDRSNLTTPGPFRDPPPWSRLP
jgi:hypothetical protein